MAFIITAIFIIVGLMWMTDHYYLWFLLRDQAKIIHDERAYKASYKMSFEQARDENDRLKKEKTDLAFRVAQSQATLKAKIVAIARELDEMVK